LFSASDDGIIRLWDLAARACVRQFEGHVGQVQSIRLVYVDYDGSSEDPDTETFKLFPDSLKVATEREGSSGFTRPANTSSGLPSTSSQSAPVGARMHRKKGPHPLLISGSLDNTLKLWDIESGKTLQTYFGHIEGVWAVAGDKLRLVSASHDRTIKIWERDAGNCTSTLFGHRGAVTCLALSDDKIVSGSDDGDVRIWSFGPEPSSTPVGLSPSPTPTPLPFPLQSSNL